MQVDARLLHAVVACVKQVGEALLPYHHRLKPLDQTTKPDGTFVTAADRYLDQLLREHLSFLLPEVPILSEEHLIPSFSERSLWPTYWCVDPLDGTRGFIAKSDEFSVNVALIQQHRPILGVIYAPAKQLCYWAAANLGAFVERAGCCHKMAVRHSDSDEMVWLAGHFLSEHIVSLLRKQSKVKLQQCHSAIKLGYIAEGLADCYPKHGATSEWDIAAGQIIVEEAGGAVLDFTGKPLQYNCRDSLVNPPFMALGDPSQFEECLQLFQSMRRE